MQVEELEHVLRRSATARMKEETKICYLRAQLGGQVCPRPFLKIYHQTIFFKKKKKTHNCILWCDSFIMVLSYLEKVQCKSLDSWDI